MSRYPRTVRPGQSSTGNWIGFGIIVLIAIAIGGFFLVRSMYRSYVLSPFSSSLAEYTNARPTGALSNKPCKGGIIPIDSGTNTIDYIYFDMPDGLKAANPAAVKTIVFLQWNKQETHKYQGGKPGYTHFCHVQVVDRETKEFLREQQFQGSEPPLTISSRSGSGEGSRPTEAIVQFLKASSTK